MANFKKGQRVVRVLVGGGCKTASIAEVESVKRGVVHLVNCESLSWRDSDGGEIDPAIPGFYSEIIDLEG